MLAILIICNITNSINIWSNLVNMENLFKGTLYKPLEMMGVKILLDNVEDVFIIIFGSKEGFSITDKIWAKL